jgi:hypothetical protein
VATYSGDTQRQYRLMLAKETRDRFQEDALASRLLLRAVAEASGVSSAQQLALGELPGDELQVWQGCRARILAHGSATGLGLLHYQALALTCTLLCTSSAAPV